MAVSDPEHLSGFEQIVGVLQKHRVEFIVIGGQAEGLMGSPRVTYDTDITYRRTNENLEKLLGALKEIGVWLRGAPQDLPFVLDRRTLDDCSSFTFDSRFGGFDLLGYVEPVGDFEEIQKRAERFSQSGFDVMTIGLEDLIRVKNHIKRSKDKESLFQLLAIQARRERASQGPKAAD